MGKRSAVVELFLGDMGSMQRELRPSTQREDQLIMETELEQIAVKAVNQLPKSVVREIRTPRSVGAGGGRPPPATRWDGKRGVAEWPKLPRPSSTLPSRTFPFRFGTMGENIELLIQIQHQVIQCRRLANEISDPETSRRLHELADEIERRAREVDQEGYTGQ